MSRASTGDTFADRSTFEDLHNAPGAPHNASNRWDLGYLKSLGMNWLWFQPIHPNGIDGREPSGGWDTATPPYDPGSPYAVKNFFEVNELMSVNYNGANTTAQNRAASMTAFQNFVASADTEQVGVMLDAPFNHTAFDVELAEIGVELFEPDGQTWSPTDEIRTRDARFFSRDGNYAERAFDANSIAAGPDRFDFGKWRDVKDVFFGRYDALVESDSEPERSSYTNEGDWFDFTDAEWTANDFVQNGQNRNVTRLVWEYFAEYAVHWLEQTRPAGENRNSATEAGLTDAERYAWDARGVDGLRCDFGQGLPPRAWEYIINVARSHKWNFVMMSESLDGGAVTYRSARHFDILNENIVFPLKSAGNAQDYRNIFEGRRTAYGQGLVLLNNTSHDEEVPSDPWSSVIRSAVTGMIDGATMIFPGQELGISTTYGYNHYELNFGKEIAHFKRWNSMQPIWSDTDFGNDQLYPVYAGIQTARAGSPALRSSNRWFLDGDGSNSQIFATAKYETANAPPGSSDVVIGFANLDRNNTQSDNFKLPVALADLLGLQSGRTYNVKNAAAYTAQDGTRREVWLWGGGKTRADLVNDGMFVSLNPVPTTGAAWSTAPYEAQYLKVYDVTAPTGTPAQPAGPNPYPYGTGESVTFDWADVAPEGGVVPSYEVTVTVDGGVADTQVVSDSAFTYTGAHGEEVSITVRAVNPDEPSNAGPAGTPSASVKLLDPDGDEDSDGQSNRNEQDSGTNPLDDASVFRVVNPVVDGSGITFEVQVVEGYHYQVISTPDLTNPASWSVEDDANATFTAGTGVTTFAFTDADPGPQPRHYRVRVYPPGSAPWLP